LLRTKDDSAGKQARCPECGTLLTVPGTAAATTPPAIAQAATARHPAAIDYGAQQGDSDNPYMSPRTSHMDDSETAAPGGELRRTALDVGETLKRTWRILWRNLGACLLATIIVAILTTVPRLPVSQWSRTALQRGDWGTYFGWLICDNLIWMLIYAYVGAGMRLFMLKIARGERAPIGTLFAGGKYYFRLLIGGMLFTLLTGLGIFTLFIGTVVVMLFYWPFGYLIVDRNLGVIESFAVSAKITAGNRLTVLATYLIAVILGSVFTVLTCGIGILVFFPYLLLLPSVMYLSMSGQPTAEPLQE